MSETIEIDCNERKRETQLRYSLTEETSAESGNVSNHLIFLLLEVTSGISSIFNLQLITDTLSCNQLLSISVSNTPYRNYRRSKVLICTLRPENTLNVKEIGRRGSVSFLLWPGLYFQSKLMC